MNDSIDRQLRAGLYEPPADFAARVMAELDERPVPVPARPVSPAHVIVEWLALAGAVVAGLAQLLPFLFGVWTVSNAG